MHDYYQIKSDDLGKNSHLPIVKLGETGEVYYEIAREMIRSIKAAAAQNKACVMIVPVGPVGQYPIFVRLVNQENISLRHVTFINMDEYLTEDGNWLPIENRLSFRGFMERTVYSQINPELVMPQAQRIFPDPHDLTVIPRIVATKGIDLCVGGIGITGHVAFNEPEQVEISDYLTRQTRCLTISAETLTVNSVGDLNGAIEAMPRQAVTIGFREIYAAKKIRLYVFRNWHRAVIRRAAYGEVSAQFPVSLLQNHQDASITCNHIAAEPAY